MRSLTCLWIIGLALGGNAPPAIAAERDTTVIQMADIAGIQSIQATIGGKPGTFLFDSGIGVSAITPEIATAIGCKPWGKLTGFRAIGERVDMQLCNETRLVVGGLPMTMPQVAVIDLKHFMGAAGAKFAGVLGLDIFAGQVVTIRVAQGQIGIETAKSLARIAAAGHAVPLRLVRAAEGAALTADFGVPTSSGMSWWEVDTGNYGQFLVDRAIAPLLGLKPDEKQPQILSATLVAGVRLAGPALVKDLILNGNIGRSFLKNWNVTLDLSQGHAWIAPARKESAKQK
jgi:hypothetical protein